MVYGSDDSLRRASIAPSINFDDRKSPPSEVTYWCAATANPVSLLNWHRVANAKPQHTAESSTAPTIIFRCIVSVSVGQDDQCIRRDMPTVVSCAPWVVPDGSSCQTTYGRNMLQRLQRVIMGPSGEPHRMQRGASIDFKKPRTKLDQSTRCASRNKAGWRQQSPHSPAIKVGQLQAPRPVACLT